MASPLYTHLGALPLLNLACSPNFETNDSDYKHLEKWIASALRKSGGILIAHIHIDSSLIQRHLLKVPGVTPETVASLFDQGDHQNVPKAYKLLSLLSQASSVERKTICI